MQETTPMADLQMVVCITLPQTVIALYIRTYVYTHRSRSATLQPTKTQTDAVEVALIVAKFTDEQYTTINQSTAGRFNPRVFVNCLPLVSS